MPTLNPNEVHFPQNVIEMLALAFEIIVPPSDTEDGIRIYKRPLAPTDGTEVIGITPMTWVPQQESLEMRGGRFEPTLQHYAVGIQAMVQDREQERAIATHSLLSSKIRHMLYRDAAIDVALRQLVVSYELASIGAIRESVSKWYPNLQNFMNGDIKGTFVYLSTVELIIETELR